jgi:DNA-binding transcriptional MerR regulator
MFTIGEFSRITGLTIKTLRFYHERGLLVPARVEFGPGYRSDDERNVETARPILALRECEFSLSVIWFSAP